MNDRDRSDRLSAALRELGARPAPDGFTERVLDRLDARDARRRRRRSARLALAAAAVGVAAVLGALLIVRPAAAPPGPESTAARAEEIRRQQRLLREELERLQRASDRVRPVLYLASGEDYDLVVDLGPLIDQRVDAPEVPVLQDLRVRRPEAREASRREP